MGMAPQRAITESVVEPPDGLIVNVNVKRHSVRATVDRYPFRRQTERGAYSLPARRSGKLDTRSR